MAASAKAILVILFIVSVLSSARADPRPYNVVQSSEILDKIERGEPVEYFGVTIVGDLDLSTSRPPAPRIINSSLRIINSTINGRVNLSNIAMEKPVSFERTVFEMPANFFQTQFDGGVDFSDSRFNDIAVFRRAFIGKSAEFKRIQFNDTADFWRTDIQADTSDFEGAQFKGIAQFWMAQLAVGNANFEWSQFEGFASFWGAKFSGDANFRGTQFEDGVDLTMAQFNGSADFMGTEIKQGLYFNEVKFKTFIVQWSSIGDELICNGPPYLQLIKNFKEQEQFEDADNCYYQYRAWKQSNRPIGWLKLFDFLAWISCGYGVRWTHTILSGVLVMVLFAIYYELFSIQDHISFLSLKGSSKIVDKYELLRSMKVAMSFSGAILLSLPFEWYPLDRDEYTNLVKTHLCSTILERMIGWGLMLLLIGTLTRLMVRY